MRAEGNTAAALLSSAAKRNAENAIADLPIYDFRTIGVFCAFINRAEKLRCGCERNIIFVLRLLRF